MVKRADEFESSQEYEDYVDNRAIDGYALAGIVGIICLFIIWLMELFL